jgi:N-acetylglucosamine kinase-like BadF-type ATPase
MELIARVYRPGLVPADLAILAPVVTHCAEQGDAVAQQLVNGAADALATAVRAVCAALDFKQETPLAMTGGLILSSIVQKAFSRALEQLPYRISPITPVEEPVRGALRLAQELARADANDG